MYAEKTTAMFAASGILAAVFAKGRDPEGKGQSLRTGILAACVTSVLPDVMWNSIWKRQEFPPGGFPSIPDAYCIMQTKDKKAVLMLSMLADKEWQDCRRIFKDTLILPPGKEETWDSGIFARAADLQEVVATWRSCLGSLDHADFERLAEEAGLVQGSSRTRGEVLTDPQILHNKIIESHTDPRFGPCRLARPAAVFGGTPQQIRAMAPLPGEHSVATLQEWAGLTMDEIQALGGKGICAQHAGV